MSDLDCRYERILDAVSRPSRYVGNELGAVRKDPKKVVLRFALAFPDVYEIAQSHLGLQLLYDLLNRRADTYAERIYAPWTDMEAALRHSALPLASLETRTPLRDFQIVGFSLQYELTYTNLLMMLDLGGIPIRAAERGPDSPLIMAGGPCAFNPEPLADFLDAVLLGDGEEAIHEVCDAYLAWDGRDRTVLLDSLSRIGGVYVPAFFSAEYERHGRLRAIHARRDSARVEKRILRDLNAVPERRTYVLPNLRIIHDRPSLEVMRGCVKGCRFCQAGYIYRPQREVDPRRVLAQAQDAVQQTGCEELSLLSLSTGDYSCVNPVLTEIMNRFAARKVAVSLPSTRVDALAAPLLEQIKRVRKTGFTLAPEAGTQRLRDIIQKQYSEDDLVEAAKQIFALGWRSLKLYFMVGLPTETEDDLRGIAALAAKVAAAGGSRHLVTASVSTFVPKPHTPFQWAAQIPIEEIRARQRFLRQELTRRRIRFKWHDARGSCLEGIFARGDRRLGKLLLTAYQRGCRFDAWTDTLRFDLWEQAWEACAIDPATYHRRRLLDEVLPWDHLGSGVTKTFLRRELGRAFRRTSTPDCNTERCAYCGVCDFDAVRNVTYHLRGAKGGEHRGQEIDRWARALVPGNEEGAWEPHGWQLVQARRPKTQLAAAAIGDRQAQAADRDHAPAAAGAADPKLQAAARGRASAAGDGQPQPSGIAAAWAQAETAPRGQPAKQTTMTARLRLRLEYSKLGRARFIGHLELGTLFSRAARRAGLPLVYSQGHHPLPRFAFSPALPVGVESVCEYLDLDLSAPADAHLVRVQFNEQMPDGIRIQHAQPIPLSAPRIEAEIFAFRYQIDLQEPQDTAVIRTLAEAFLAAEKFPLRKHNRSGDRIVDARLLVTALTVPGPDRIEAVIRFGPGGTVKPADLVRSLFAKTGREAPPFRVRKTETLCRREPLIPAALSAAARA